MTSMYCNLVLYMPSSLNILDLSGRVPGSHQGGLGHPLVMHRLHRHTCTSCCISVTPAPPAAPATPDLLLHLHTWHLLLHLSHLHLLLHMSHLHLLLHLSHLSPPAASVTPGTSCCIYYTWHILLHLLHLAPPAASVTPGTSCWPPTPVHRCHLLPAAWTASELTCMTCHRSLLSCDLHLGSSP